MNPLVAGTLAMITGDVLGSLVDHVGTMIDARVRTALGQVTTSSSLMDTTLALGIHSWLTILTTEFAASALPWLTEEPSSFVLFLMGVWATSPHLVQHLQEFNKVLLEDSFSIRAPDTIKLD